MSLSRTVALITGAGQGLGLATATRLASKGAYIGVVDLAEDKVHQLCKTLGDRSIPLVLDVTSENDMQNAMNTIVNKWGKLDVVVNCAGVAPPMRTLNKKGQPHNLEQFKKVLNVNTIGTFNVIRLAAEKMALNKGDNDGRKGVIINTASIAAMDGQIGQAAYAASKGAIVSMTLPIARDLSSFGIRVCTIAPGLFMTPMMEGLPEQVKSDLAKTVPFPKRLGIPDEYAILVESIINNPMLNGETIRLDGALRMQP